MSMNVVMEVIRGSFGMMTSGTSLLWSYSSNHEDDVVQELRRGTIANGTTL
jgi:VCBS repeat-containing protein